jgi:pyrroline-5-carboxylate reductase
MISKRIGFLGFGHMAQILLAGMIREGIVSPSHVSFFRRDTDKTKQNEADFGIKSAPLSSVISNSDILFLCIRPQQAQDFFKQLEPLNLAGKLVISVLAGTPLSVLEKGVGNGVQVIRSMPNIASEVGQGMTVLAPSESCDAASVDLATKLFESVGLVSVQPESMMDVACGMSGSGPGFVLRLINAMAKVGLENGMSEADALQIASQTFLGAASLVLNGAIPNDLLSQIATPQGTTAAGFASMDTLNVDVGFTKAIEAAAARSRNLSKTT